MTNLLPNEYKKIVHAEYMRRLGIVFLWILAVIMIIVGLALSPIAIKIYYEEKQIDGELQLLKSKPAVHDYSGLEKEIKKTRNDLDILRNEVPVRPHIMNMIENVLSVKKAGINIDSIVWLKEEGYFRLMVGGRANDREILRRFVNDLKANSIFMSVDLPVSSFAKPEDVDFTVTIKITDAKNEDRK